MLDVQTRNLMTEALYEATRKEYILPSFKCVKIIYEGTMDSSNPVRLWIVDLVTNCATPDFFNGMEDTTPKEFLREFAQQVLKSRGEAEAPEDYDMDEYMESENKFEDRKAVKAAMKA
jgi:hypothetical protein